MNFIKHDGGRAKAGFKGEARDCVVRSIAIAAKLDYNDVYNELRKRSNKSPRNGVNKKVYGEYLKELGFTWVPTMGIGTGCIQHLDHTLPNNRLIVKTSRHLTAVIHGTIYDNHDPSRNGKRCVYGYWCIK